MPASLAMNVPEDNPDPRDPPVSYRSARIDREAEREVARLNMRHYSLECERQLKRYLWGPLYARNSQKALETETRIYLLATTAAHHARLYLGM